MAKTKGRSTVRAELAAVKKERIITTASELFARLGYDNTRLDMVADEMGVTKPFIYSEFDSKADLLAEICMRAVTTTLDATADVPNGEGSPSERLRLFARLFVTAVCTHQTDVAVFANEQKNLAEQDRLKLNKERRELDHRVVGLLREGIDSGEFNISRPRITALAIQGMISWMYVWYRPDGMLPLDVIADEMAENVLTLAIGGSSSKAKSRKHAA